MEDGRKKIVPVCGSSKSSRNTAKYFDHVVYCEVKNRKHIAASSTAFSNTIVTGSRTDFEMEKMESLSLISLFESHVVKPPSPGQVAMSNLAKGVAGK